MLLISNINIIIGEKWCNGRLILIVSFMWMSYDIVDDFGSGRWYKIGWLVIIMFGVFRVMRYGNVVLFVVWYWKKYY